jgi:phage repressor protein C with HTH and peptisase S24 domain
MTNEIKRGKNFDMKKDAADILRDRINAAIPEKFKNITDVAKKADISQGNFSAFMAGKRKGVNLETAWKLFSVLGPDLPAIDGTKMPTTDNESSKSVSAAGLTVLGVYAVAGAGPAWDAEDDEPMFNIAVPARYLRPHIIPLFINGTSMEPTILDNAVVGVNREHKDVVQGKIYAVRLPHEGIVIKRLYIDHKQKCFVLKSDNQKDAAEFPDVFLSFEDGDSFIYGRVSWVLQSYDR